MQAERADPNRPAGTDDDYGNAIGRADKILAERWDSALADCPVALIFDGMKLFTSDGKILFTARSGKPDAVGMFDYSVTRQATIDAGPIPAGGYWINPCEVKSGTSAARHTGLSTRAFEGWGPMSVTIHPFTTTHTYGRYGFFIHGGRRWGSAGCIDLRENVSAFFAQMDMPGLCRRQCKIKLDVHYFPPGLRVPTPSGALDAALGERIEQESMIDEILREWIFGW